MASRQTLLALVGPLLFALPVSAQNDPFGGGGQDPFAAKPETQNKKPDNQQERKDPIAAPTTKPQAEVVTNQDASDVSARFRKVLGEKSSLTAIETPLVDALRILSEQHQIPIFANVRALEELGIASDTPITISLKNVSLRSLLRLMLDPLDLTYMIKDEVLMITTAENAEQNLSVRMFVIPDSLVEKSDQVIRALTASVVPDTWESTGGPSAVSAVDHVLVVSATEHVHEEVIEFIRKLDEAYKRHQSKNKK